MLRLLSLKEGMSAVTKTLLGQLARRHKTYADNLRKQPALKWAALGSLYRMPGKERFSLKEWSETVSYLLGCIVRFETYAEIEASLKPFALEVK